MKCEEVEEEEGGKKKKNISLFFSCFLHFFLKGEIGVGG